MQKINAAHYPMFRLRQQNSCSPPMDMTQWISSLSGLAIQRGEQHTSIVLYTSGTTGHPKGTLITRQSLTSNADGIIRWLGFDARERLNLVLPLHHINSTTFSITSLMVGGSPCAQFALQRFGVLARHIAGAGDLCEYCTHDYGRSARPRR